MNDIYLVDCKKVAKQTNGLGEFMLMTCDSGNLLVSSQFILNIPPEQFWSVRCKLEVPRLGIWYFYSKEGPVRSERPPGIEEWEQKYHDWINQAKDKLTNTRIELMGCYLYTDGFKYKAIKQERINMLQPTEELFTSDNMVIVDGVHVLAPVTDKVWKNNTWLLRLPGMNIEKESEDEQ